MEYEREKGIKLIKRKQNTNQVSDTFSEGECQEYKK